MLIYQKLMKAIYVILSATVLLSLAACVEKPSVNDSDAGSLDDMSGSVVSELDAEPVVTEPPHEVIIGDMVFQSDDEEVYICPLNNDVNIDLSVLTEFTRLRILTLGGVCKYDCTVLPHLNRLKELNLGGGFNNTDLSFLNGMDSLETLTFEYAENIPPESYEHLACCPHLKKIVISAATIPEFSYFLPLNELEFIGLSQIFNSEHPFTDYTCLSELTSLKRIQIEANAVPYLYRLPNLTKLYLMVSPDITDETMEMISNMTQLEYLSIPNAHITDLKQLERLTKLRFLDISGIKEITDISPLRNMNDLEVLRMGQCSVSDISPLAGKTKLHWLEAESNNISDISCLYDSFAKSYEKKEPEYVTGYNIMPWGYYDSQILIDLFNNNVSNDQLTTLCSGIPDCAVRPLE